MTLPRRKEKPRSGIARAVKREWPRHRAWVRSFECCVPGCTCDRIEFAHVRLGGDGGTGLKPHDGFGISLCVEHHRESHRLGEATFAKKHGIDLQEIAAAFRKESPDFKMRESFANAA